jgi:hypothetical protein
MKIFVVPFIVLALLTSACSSTPTAQINVNKKPLISDHHLLLSLLDRPVTPDQQLMLAFAKQQDIYQQQNPTFVNSVMMLGERNEAPAVKTLSPYYTMIANDNNAIRISGPN